MFFDSGLESGRHVDIIAMLLIAWYSRVVNMLRVGDCVFFWGGDFDIGQHVEIHITCYIMFDLRVANLLRFYTCFYCIGFESGQYIEIL